MGYRVLTDGELTITPTLAENDLRELRLLEAAAGRDGLVPSWWTLTCEYIGRQYPHDCRWFATEDGGALLVMEECEPDTDALEHLIGQFLGPRGYVVNGRVDWQGEDPDDRGAVFVRDNVVRWSKARITIEDPFTQTTDDANPI